MKLRAATSFSARPLRWGLGFLAPALAICFWTACQNDATSGNDPSAPDSVAPMIRYESPMVDMIGTASSHSVVSSGGTVSVYHITPFLPWGLSFDTLTGLISGTPTELQGAVIYRVVASGPGGKDTAGLTLSVIPYSTPEVPSLLRLTVNLAALNPSSPPLDPAISISYKQVTLEYWALEDSAATMHRDTTYPGSSGLTTGYGQQSLSFVRTIDKRDWRYRLRVLDKKDTVLYDIGWGAPSMTTYNGVYQPRFIMYDAGFRIPDSVSRVGVPTQELKVKRLTLSVNGRVVADSTSPGFFPAWSTPKLRFNYMPAAQYFGGPRLASSVTRSFFKMVASGTIGGVSDSLFAQDSIVVVNDTVRRVDLIHGYYQITGAIGPASLLGF